MDPMQPQFILGLMLAATALVLLLAAWVLWLRLQAAGHRLQLRELTNKLEKTREELKLLTEERDEQRRFLTSLNQAEITSRLRQQRQGDSAGDAARPLERYRYAEKMAASGMPSEDIARVLAMSEIEARQVVTLMSMARADEQKPLSRKTQRPKKTMHDARTSPARTVIGATTLQEH